ncbi:hypothetical protein V2J09_014403 [Rumex salicifolius]
MANFAQYLYNNKVENMDTIRKYFIDYRGKCGIKRTCKDFFFPKGLLKASKARTSAFLHPMGSLSKSFLEILLSSFTCLRELMLSEFEELPDLIGNLKHLRASKCHLQACEIQTLDFGYWNKLAKLPKDMHRLVSLRSLIVMTKATCLPKEGFQCWSSLRNPSFISCLALTSSPESMRSLKSLERFQIESCSNHASLPDNMN